MTPKRIEITVDAKGKDPDKVWIKKSPLSGHQSRFQSMKRFRDDCKKIGGTLGRITIDGTNVTGTCKLDGVTEVNVEEYVSKGAPKEKFGFVAVTKKGVNNPMYVVGFGGMQGSSSGVHLKKRGQERAIDVSTEYRTFEKALGFKRYDLMPVDEGDTSYGASLIKFPKPTKCTVTAFSNTVDTQRFPALSFHSKRSKFFRPNLAVVRTVRTDCKI